MTRIKASPILDRLRANPKMAEELVKIEFTNQLQDLLVPAVELLSRARKGLEIVVGDRSGAVKVWSRKRKSFILITEEEATEESSSSDSDSSETESSESESESSESESSEDSS